MRRPAFAVLVVLFLIACDGPEVPVSRLASVQITPDKLVWLPYPSGGEQAFVVSNPMRAGPYVVRLRLPKGTKLAPHYHPDARISTVMSGTMYFGYGETADTAKMRAYPPGSVWTELPRQPHFAWARDGEVVIQVVGTGPSGMTAVR